VRERGIGAAVVIVFIVVAVVVVASSVYVITRGDGRSYPTYPTVITTVEISGREIRIYVLKGFIATGEWQYSVSSTPGSYSWTAGAEPLNAPSVSLGKHAVGTWYVGLRHKDSQHVYFADSPITISPPPESHLVVATDGTGDYNCDGVNDHIEIQTALMDLPLSGGTVYLKEGTYIISGRIEIGEKENVALVGAGMSTVLKLENGLDHPIYMIAVFVNDILIKDLRLNGNKANQTFSSGMDGIFCLIVEDLRITNCRIENFAGSGIQLKHSGNNVISNNTFENNSCGIRLVGPSNGNLIYHNNFVNNDNQAYDNGVNYWDDDYPSGGNYWSDYMGEDADDDGVGDLPYEIPGDNNQDHYPLMGPV
jgi:parallel beta-helix repeat protein